MISIQSPRAKEHCLSPLNILPAVKISGDGISDDSSEPLPLTTACIGGSTTDIEQDGISLELCTEVSNSETHSNIDETDLGDFLLDTFETMEAQGGLLAQLEMAV